MTSNILRKVVTKITLLRRKYSPSQQFAILTFIAIVLALPVTTILVQKNTETRSRAANQYPVTSPVTPPSVTSAESSPTPLLSPIVITLSPTSEITSIPFYTPTPTPVSTSKISWSTKNVWLEADNFYILANGKQFFGKPDPGTTIAVGSDPGGPTYTTLEAVWKEQGVEMRLFIYFYADKTLWWSPEFRTYDGQNPGDWIYYYGRFFESQLGQSFKADVLDIKSTKSTSNLPGSIHFENLSLKTYFQEPLPTGMISPTSIPIPTKQEITLTQPPSPTKPPSLSRPPVLTLPFYPYFARVGRRFFVAVKGYDLDTDDILTMKIFSLPSGLSQGPCNQGIDSQKRKTIQCVVSGTPKRRGFYTLPITLKDGREASSRRYMRLFIL